MITVMLLSPLFEDVSDTQGQWLALFCIARDGLYIYIGYESLQTQANNQKQEGRLMLGRFLSTLCITRVGIASVDPFQWARRRRHDAADV